MLRLDAAAEQLASEEHRAVAAVCTTAGTPEVARWRALELRLAEAVAEARETAKYLATLQASLDGFYTSERMCCWGCCC